MFTINGISGVEAQNKMHFVFTPVPADISIAGFTLLTTIAIALQVAARSPILGFENLPHEIARRQFLGAFANSLIPAAAALGFYITAQYWSGPHTFDPVRLFGPSLLALLVALAAADAGLAASPEFGTHDLRAAWKRKRVQALKRAEDALTGSGRWPSKQGRINEACAMVVIPLSAVHTFLAFDASLTLLRYIGAVAISVIAVCLIYAFIYLTLRLAALRSWFEFSLMLALAALLTASVILGSIQFAVAQESMGAPESVLPWTLLLLMAVAGPPTGLGLWAARFSPNRTAGLLRYHAARRVRQKRFRLLNEPEDKQTQQGEANRTSFHPFVIIGMCLSVVPPFGAVFCAIALQEIMRIQSSSSNRGGGKKTAIAVLSLNVAAAVTLVVCLGWWAATAKNG